MPLDDPRPRGAEPRDRAGTSSQLRAERLKGAHVSIEQGYFIFTLMPSLFCKLRCPHCYLSLEQRQDPTIMSLDDLELTCRKVDAYYRDRAIGQKTIVCYWYGGEPTSMGQAYVTDACDRINGVFTADAGYDVKHTILTSMVGVDASWFPIFDRYGKGEVQSSFDGLMRGAGYMRVWDRKIREAVAYGLRVATISVVNRALLDDGPKALLDYLADLGVAETSWLPFMWNEQNDGDQYDGYAPTMNEYSDFMIELSDLWLARRQRGDKVPEIGQLRFIHAQKAMPMSANVAGQTLFLQPNGDFVLPDYKNGWQEFMQPFGNILTQSFEEVLTSPARRRYLRRQFLRNGNSDCASCDHADKCIMEFWKDNRPGDDCFGAKRFVEWVLAHEAALDGVIGTADQPMLY